MAVFKSLGNLGARMRTFSNWYTVEMMFAGVRKAQGQAKLWNGLKVSIRCLVDLSVVDEVCVKKCYDQEINVPSHGVVVDVGAHIGTFSLYAAKMCGAKAVYSFEPSPENFEMLRLNVENNHLEYIIKPVQKAVSEKEENRELHLTPDNTGGHSLYVQEWAKQEGTVLAQCTTLKRILQENELNQVDYLKLDCEGAEWEILQTVDSETIAKVDRIGMEYHYRPRNEFVELLEHLGFKVLPSKSLGRKRSYIMAIRS